MSDKPRISARAFIRRENKVLLIQYKDEGGFWYVMPGGGQNNGETLVECLKREVKEELGTGIEVHEMLYVREIISDRHPGTYLPKGFHQVEIFFNCTLIGSLDRPSEEPDPGQIGFGWHEIDTLKEIRFFPMGIADKILDRRLSGTYLGEIR